MKKLKINTVIPNHKLTPYFDTYDTTFAKQHQGKYLIANIKKHHNRKSNRLYLSLKEDIEYFNERAKRGEINLTYKPKLREYHLFDKYPNYKIFIKSTLHNIVKDVIDFGVATRLLNGLSIFIQILIKSRITLYSFEEITNYHQKLAIKIIDDISNFRTDRKDLRQFFGKVEENIENFDILDGIEVRRKESIRALPSNIVYKIDIYARKELDHIIEQHNEYKAWINKFKDIDLFSVGNLVLTHHQNSIKYGRSAGPFNRILNLLLLTLHGIDFAALKKSTSETSRLKYNKLVIESKNGINIEIVNEEMYAVWHNELYPDFPFSRKITQKYKTIYTNDKSFKTNIPKKLNISLTKFHARIAPMRNSMYPLILFIPLKSLQMP